MRATFDEALTPILLVLTTTTGIVDAVSFLALGHVFTANMTGNVVFLGFAMAGAGGVSIACSIAALVAFIAGAIAGGRMASVMQARGRKAWTTAALWTEALLLGLAAIVAWRFDPASGAASPRIYAIVVLLAIAMGMRNAVVRKLAVPNLTTTVLTLTIAGIGGDSSWAGGTNPALALRAGSVLLMLLGALVGAVMLPLSVSLPLACAAVGAAACALVAHTMPQAPAPATAG